MMNNQPPQPPGMMPPVVAQNVLNQSQMTSNSAASSTNPQYADINYAQLYFQEIQQMFVSPEFKNSQPRQKKEIVGNTIYKHVEKLVGD